MCKKMVLLLSCLAGVGCASQPDVLERELGTFDLKLGTAPTRSMAHGLVSPASAGALRGGLDLSHASGWYLGNWSPSMGLPDGSQPELNSYLGYTRHNPDGTAGYELGVIRYSFPVLEQWDRHEYYAGLNFNGGRLGGAVSSAAGRTDTTLLLDLGWLQPLGLDLQVKTANHALDARQYHPGGHLRRFQDWSLNLSRSRPGLRLGLSYSGSSLSGAQCGAYSGQNPRCEGLLTLQAERALF